MDVKLRYELDLAPESRWNILSSTAAAKNALLYAQEAGDFTQVRSTIPRGRARRAI